MGGVRAASQPAGDDLFGMAYPQQLSEFMPSCGKTAGVLMRKAVRTSGTEFIEARLTPRCFRQIVPIDSGGTDLPGVCKGTMPTSAAHG